jgi:hypothetical protein
VKKTVGRGGWEMIESLLFSSLSLSLSLSLCLSLSLLFSSLSLPLPLKTVGSTLS